MEIELIQTLFLVFLAGLTVAIAYKLLQCLCWGAWCIFAYFQENNSISKRTLLLIYVLLLPITLVISLLIGLFIVFNLPGGLRNSWPSRQEN